MYAIHATTTLSALVMTTDTTASIDGVITQLQPSICFALQRREAGQSAQIRCSRISANYRLTTGLIRFTPEVRLEVVGAGVPAQCAFSIFFVVRGAGCCISMQRSSITSCSAAASSSCSSICNCRAGTSSSIDKAGKSSSRDRKAAAGSSSSDIFCCCHIWWLQQHQH